MPEEPMKKISLDYFMRTANSNNFQEEKTKCLGEFLSEIAKFINPDSAIIEISTKQNNATLELYFIAQISSVTG